MINANKWMLKLTDKLKVYFKNRLLFVGLQGSYQRKEAHHNSDIDAVIILDVLSINDLIAYREILSTMPESDKSCGFISGKQELMNWPKHELFQFKQDTRSYHGTLEELLPNICDKDIVDSVKISASGLYHSCCHTIVHTPSSFDILKDMYKSAFFLLQAIYYLRNGVYISTKKDLLPLLEGDEKEILNISINWNTYTSAIITQPDFYFDLIIRWAATILNTQF